MTETAVAVAEPRSLDLAIIKAVGWDRLAPEQRELALAISRTYGLDPMLRHLAIIDGRPVVTRDGLLHVAHRSGVFDGIQVTPPVLVDGFWRCVATVWRRDMSHPIEYPGRFPDAGRKGRPTEYAEEMAIKVAESMALRRAFDVAAPIMEERWDVEVPAEPPPPRPTLAERAAAKAAEVPPLVLEPMTPEASAGAPVEGLSAHALITLATQAKRTKADLAAAIGCEVGQIVERLGAMSDIERGVLADELNLDWRTA